VKKDLCEAAAGVRQVFEDARLPDRGKAVAELASRQYGCAAGLASEAPKHEF
jgi:hypothetical protein